MCPKACTGQSLSFNLLQVSHTVTEVFTVSLSVQRSFLIMPVLASATTSRLLSLLFYAYFSLCFLLIYKMQSQANEEKDNAYKGACCF